MTFSDLNAKKSSEKTKKKRKDIDLSDKNKLNTSLLSVVFVLSIDCGCEGGCKG